MRQLGANLALLFIVVLVASTLNRAVTGFWTEDGLGAWGPLVDTLGTLPFMLPFVLVYLALLRLMREPLVGSVHRLRVLAVILSPIPFFMLLEVARLEDGLGSLQAIAVAWIPMLIYGLIVRVDAPVEGRALSHSRRRRLRGH